MTKPTTHVLPRVAIACFLLCAGASAASAEEDAATLSARGRAQLHAGKSKEAEATLRKAAKLLGPNTVEGLYEVARVELASDDLRRAKNACRALVEKDEHAVLSQVCQARAFLAWRRASRADEFLDAARAKDASHPEVLLAYADAKRVSGDLQASKDAYQQVLGLDGSRAEAYYGLGLLALVQPDRDAAQKAFREALAHEPEWIDAQYELGRIASGAEAVSLLEKVLAARPSSIDAQLSLSSAKLANGDEAGAEALLRAVLKSQPKHALAHARLGMALLAKGDHAGAEAELTQGAAALPNDADVVLALARVYAATDRAEDAFEKFRSAASLDRQNPRALIDAGVYALKISRNALAQAFLEKALERAPKSAEAHARYADSLLARGEKASAKEHYKQALSGEGTIDRDDVQRRLAALP